MRLINLCSFLFILSYVIACDCPLKRSSPNCEILTPSLEYIKEEYFFSKLNEANIYISTEYDGISSFVNYEINQVDSTICCMKIQGFGKKVECNLKYPKLERTDFEERNKNASFFTFTEPHIKRSKAVIVINFETKNAFASLLVFMEKIGDKWKGKQIVEIGTG